jgi:undecaprenyl pyrophosphate synthase
VPAMPMPKAEVPAAVADASFEVPRHVAIIMDGNGRWAAARGLPRTEGHRRGVEALRATVRAAGEMGILLQLGKLVEAARRGARPHGPAAALHPS